MDSFQRRKCLKCWRRFWRWILPLTRTLFWSSASETLFQTYWRFVELWTLQIWIMSRVNVLEWTETINRCVCDRRFVVFLQAMIRGELEVLKDWCYEAVRSSTQTQMLADLHLLCHDFIFCLFADVQSARSSRSTGQSHGTPVPLQDSGHRQHRRKQIKTFMRPKNPTNT